MRIDIYFWSGNIESYEPVAMGSTFGAGNVMSLVMFMTKDMHEKGIRLATGYFSNTNGGNKLDDNYVIREIELVSAEEIDLVYKVKIDGVTVMGVDEDGKILNPIQYDCLLNELNASEDEESISAP